MAYFPLGLQPDFSERRAVRSTFVNPMGQHILAARKEMEVWHTITYTYSKITTRMYRIIDNFFRTMDGRVSTFYVADFGDPKLVKAIDSKGYITVNNKHGLTASTGGGNRIILWKNTVEQAYGNDSTFSVDTLTDPGQAWTTNQWQNHKLMDTSGLEVSVNSNTANTITVNASIDSGAYDLYRYEEFTIDLITDRVLDVSASPVMTYAAMEQFTLPVYTCRFMGDSLDGLNQTGEWNKEPNDQYGPYFSGTVEFMQHGTGS